MAPRIPISQGSDFILVARVRDPDTLVGIAGADVKLTIYDQDEAAVIADQTMVDQADGTGEYHYLGSDTLLPDFGPAYQAKVVSVVTGKTHTIQGRAIDMVKG